jgi:hypothetical protein
MSTNEAENSSVFWIKLRKNQNDHVKVEDFK